MSRPARTLETEVSIFFDYRQTIIQMQKQGVVFVIIFVFLLAVVQSSGSPSKLRKFLTLPRTESPERPPETHPLPAPAGPVNSAAKDNLHRNDVQNGYRPVLEETFFVYSKRAPAGRRVCGKQLTSLLSLVCNGRYSTGGRKRRSAPTRDIEIDELMNGNRSQVDELMNGNRSQAKRKRYPEEDSGNEATGSGEPVNMVRVSMQRRSNAIFLHRRQDEDEDGTTGAYTECCLKPCAVKDMIGYCHPDVQKSKYGVGS
ncbi:hypothetical protein RvY_09193 [Ramazzottius varieornatus]|uniref:Insulin-like domain-containing protein n=1 Tax=Ramazzottius varieornatus TaxID=947166 RepID=A0A1D1VGF3_RAMVA|nr:hypothetical protein RvY_09193 [Ramazzottius varieornatus]